MSETETTGATNSGSAENAGMTDSGSSDHGSSDSNNIREVKERAYAEMQKSEDPSDVLAETRDRQAERDGDPSVHSQERKESG